MQLRKAMPQDTERILEIIRQARNRMQAAGSTQWQDEYPARRDIETDIACGQGMVACAQAAPGSAPLPGDIMAYAAVVFSGEPAYTVIDGAWADAQDGYVVVHRLVVADEALRKGAASALLREAARQARIRRLNSFRIDTAEENTPMRGLLAALGFAPCGFVHYAHGVRLAFEKRLHDET